MTAVKLDEFYIKCILNTFLYAYRATKSFFELSRIRNKNSYIIEWVRFVLSTISKQFPQIRDYMRPTYKNMYALTSYIKGRKVLRTTIAKQMPFSYKSQNYAQLFLKD